jgi:transcriptional regulator with XRE-family HTH domain
MNGNSSFGQWLRQRRKALDLTQADLADQVGCSLATIQKIEMDERRPSKQIAEHMADVLAISRDDRATFLAFARRSEVPPPSLPVRTPQPAPLHNLPFQPTSFIGRVD